MLPIRNNMPVLLIMFPKIQEEKTLWWKSMNSVGKIHGNVL